MKTQIGMNCQYPANLTARQHQSVGEEGMTKPCPGKNECNATEAETHNFHVVYLRREINSMTFVESEVVPIPQQIN